MLVDCVVGSEAGMLVDCVVGSEAGMLVDCVVGSEAGTLVDTVAGVFGAGTLVDVGIYVAPAWLETCSIEPRSLPTGKKY